MNQPQIVELQSQVVSLGSVMHDEVLLFLGNLFATYLIDPCASGNGGCSQICQNERGIAKCECHPGHSLAADKKSCLDVDECAEGSARCAHRCVNTPGSFSCACSPGFELGADGRRCYLAGEELVFQFY
ncbi:hypothetical protein EK904_014068 [Melospiza melodia maxima]|nr:hypothetical protein EK904_014068 [Melospiza melodia maxima]